MAKSKCGACDSTAFEIKEVEPAGAKYKHYFIQCERCGIPAGIIEYRNSAKLIEEMQATLLQGQRALHAEIERVLGHVQNLERSR